MFVNFTKNVRLTDTQEMGPPRELVLSTSFVSRMEPALLVGFYGSIFRKYFKVYFSYLHCRKILVLKDLHIFVF